MKEGREGKGSVADKYWIILLALWSNTLNMRGFVLDVSRAYFSDTIFTSHYLCFI